MPKRPQLSRIVLFVLLVALVGGDAIASARYVRPAPAQNGRYGVVAGGGELIGFQVRNRVVSGLFFNMQVDCHNSETGEDYVRFFDAHEISGGRIGFNGHWQREYTSDSNGRRGSGLIEIDFRRNGRVFASVSAVAPAAPESFEDCHGFFAHTVNHGPPS